MNEQNEQNERGALLAALASFAHQRPNIEPHNYATMSSYRADAREATQQLHEVRTLLSAVKWRNIDADTIRVALSRGGRLSLVSPRGAAPVLEYCTGQYYGLEFRAAVARVLAGLVWDWERDAYAAVRGSADGFREYFLPRARREYGRRIVARYF